MEKDIKDDLNKIESSLDNHIDLDEFDNKLDDLKDYIKKLKKVKKRQEKYDKLEREKESILRKLDRKESDKKHHKHK